MDRDLSNLQMVEAFVLDLQSLDPGLTTDAAIEQIRKRFSLLGPYHFAKSQGLLVNESGEEFAVQFMQAYNLLHPGTY